MGLKSLTNSDDSLRYSQNYCESNGIQLDNSVSSTSTLNGNDVMVQVKTVNGGGGGGDAGLRLYNFIHYLASLNIEMNNQFSLLDR